MIAAAAPGPIFDFNELAPPFPVEMEYTTITEIADTHKVFLCAFKIPATVCVLAEFTYSYFLNSIPADHTGIIEKRAETLRQRRGDTF
jgi:hypothetical protein